MIANREHELEEDILRLTARLAAAERVMTGVAWLCQMVEQEKFEDAWHQVRDIVRPDLNSYENLNSAKSRGGNG